MLELGRGPRDLQDVLQDAQDVMPVDARDAARAPARGTLWPPSALEFCEEPLESAALVELLKASIPDAKDYALWSLSLSISAENQTVVLESGGVQPLIEHLDDERVLTVEQAAADRDCKDLHFHLRHSLADAHHHQEGPPAADLVDHRLDSDVPLVLS